MSAPPSRTEVSSRTRPSTHSDAEITACLDELARRGVPEVVADGRKRGKALVDWLLPQLDGRLDLLDDAVAGVLRRLADHGVVGAALAVVDPALVVVEPERGGEVVLAAEALRDQIGSGAYHPFTGPLNKQDGSAWLAEGQKATDEELSSMNFFVEGISAQIPS